MKAITKPKMFVLGTMFVAVMMLSVSALNLEDKWATAQEETYTPDERIISVTGTVTTSVDPDLLVITFGVETQEITAKDALDTNSKTMNDIIEVVQSTGVLEDDISTSRFNIYPVYEGYEDPIVKRWKQELTGYKVTNTITVDPVKLNLAADIIDSGVTSGANRVDNASFTLSQEKHLELKDELIEKAIINAKTKAENALSPLDYSITGVKAISLS
ncbi:MAG: SIMPL domain-containing protein [Nitrosopumilus sp.]